MTVSPGQIGWASYRDYEGPFWRGSAAFRMPAQPTQTDRILAVITATEGGHWDSYNGYDRCRCTSGLIQWCELGQFSVSDMLGAVAAFDRALIEPVDELCSVFGVRFDANARGRWRFHFLNGRGEVDRSEEQVALFCGSGTGHKGTWTDEDQERGKRWAAAISSVWHDARAQSLQSVFTRRRLSWFVRTEVRGIFDAAPETPEGLAFQAAYLSFAANNPTWAAEHLGGQASVSDAEPYSIDWLAGVLKALTFGPGVSIYPHRYNAIRPVLERLYGIDLPDMASELRSWVGEHGQPMQVDELQRILLDLGEDLGPWGADGKFGPKTREAVLSFQQRHGLHATGYPDRETRDALLAAAEAVAAIPEAQGLDAATRQRVLALVGDTLAKLSRDAIAKSRERHV